MRCFGLDAAWSDRRPSAACLLDTAGQVLDEAPLGGDSEIVSWVEARLSGPAVVAADIPLLVPNEMGMRPCERELHRVYGRARAGPYPASRSYLERRGRVRGEDLARALDGLGFTGPWGGGERTLLEVYPHPGLVEVLHLPERLAYKKGPVAARRAGLRRLAALLATLGNPPLIGPAIEVGEDLRGAALKAVEDRLDARFCAWTALVWARFGSSRVRLFGDPETGHIAVPLPSPTRR